MQQAGDTAAAKQQLRAMCLTELMTTCPVHQQPLVLLGFSHLQHELLQPNSGPAVRASSSRPHSCQ